MLLLSAGPGTVPSEESGLLSSMRRAAIGRSGTVPSADYYLKQAELAARLALTESDPEKAKAAHLLAVEFYDKADKARAQAVPASSDATTPPGMQRD